jgi:hypothetical protein
VSVGTVVVIVESVLVILPEPPNAIETPFTETVVFVKLLLGILLKLNTPVVLL